MNSRLRHRNTYPAATADHLAAQSIHHAQQQPPEQRRPAASGRLHRFLLRTKSFLQTERGMLFALTLASLWTRLFRLSFPANVVFDEVHFGGFTEHLLARRFPFDIHPWLGKLTFAGFAWLIGYQPQAEGTFSVTKPYTNGYYYYLRLLSALFGVACPPLMYLVARELQYRPWVSLVTAMLPLLDNLLIMESRYIVVDSQLMLYLHLALLLSLRMFRTIEDGRERSFRFYALLTGTALACACAMGVKWTAGVTPFLIAVTCFFGVWFLSRPLPLRHCFLAACIGLVAYLLPWYIFLRVATQSTSYASFRLSDSFRSTLHGNSTLPYNPNHNRSMLSRIGELHLTQFLANRKVKTRHKYESKWFEWPLNLRGIYFLALKAPGFSEEKPNINVLYLLQNPAGALVVAAAIAILATSTPVYARFRHAIPPTHRIHSMYSTAVFLLAGYFLNLLPYIFVERCYFLYHYLPALAYGQLAVGLLLEYLPRKIAVSVTGVSLCAVFLCFVYFSPWIYALTIHFNKFQKMQWLARWN